MFHFIQDQPIILHLLDIAPAMTCLSGVCMEIQDSGKNIKYMIYVVKYTKSRMRNKICDYSIGIGQGSRIN